MITAGDLSIESQSAKCEVFYRTHGRVNTHIDAISHYGFHNYGFNGDTFSDFVTDENAALRWDVTEIGPVVTRGIFVDVARKRGVSHLQPGEAVGPDEILDAAEQIEPGDAFIIRTGATLSPINRPAKYHADPHHGATCAGLDPRCVELLGGKDVSIIATDTPNECLPVQDSTYCRAPVHVLALTIFGIHLVHNMDLETIGRTAIAEQRNSFLFMLNPLRLPHATGSLVSPLAVF
jgi:kynurenine formamidase